MLKSIFHAATVLAVAAMITACFEREGEAVVNVSSVPSSVVVAASSVDDQPLRDTLVITSNRSWTAKVVGPSDYEQEVTWLQLSQNEACSISNTSFDTELVEALGYYEAGETVDIVVKSRETGYQEQTLQVTLGSRD